MKLKYRLEKYRDKQAHENYWSNPERYNIEAFQKGFNCAVQFILQQNEFKDNEEFKEILEFVSQQVIEK